MQIVRVRPQTSMRSRLDWCFNCLSFGFLFPLPAPRIRALDAPGAADGGSGPSDAPLGGQPEHHPRPRPWCGHLLRPRPWLRRLPASAAQRPNTRTFQKHAAEGILHQRRGLCLCKDLMKTHAWKEFPARGAAARHGGHPGRRRCLAERWGGRHELRTDQATFMFKIDLPSHELPPINDFQKTSARALLLTEIFVALELPRF